MFDWCNITNTRTEQFAHYKEEMYLQAQRAFGVSPDHHYRLLHSAAEEKQKIVVLTVHVQEADGLEAKDANGEYLLLRSGCMVTSVACLFIEIFAMFYANKKYIISLLILEHHYYQN